MFVNKVSFASFINSIKRRINWPKLWGSFSLSPQRSYSILPSLLRVAYICMCARAFCPHPFHLESVSPPLLLLTLTASISLLLCLPPLIFHSAWRLSWNLVNTGKLKTRFKRAFHTWMLLRFPEKNFTSVPIYKFIDAPSSAFESRILYFCKLLFSLSLSLHFSTFFPFWRETMFFLSRWHFFSTFTSFLFLVIELLKERNSCNRFIEMKSKAWSLGKLW